MARVTHGYLSSYPYTYPGDPYPQPDGFTRQFSAKAVEHWLRYDQNILNIPFGMFCSYLSQFSTIWAENWRVNPSGCWLRVRVRVAAQIPPGSPCHCINLPLHKP